MTPPRQVIPDRSYMVTRRCAERRFFLRPSKQVNQAYVYCFGVAAQRYELDVYWLSTLSNHEHPGVHDNRGNYPKFLQYFHSLLARCLNAHHGRWEHFWSAEQSGVLHLGTAESIFEHMTYALTNAVKDHLVDKVVNWPGVNSLRHQLRDEPMVAKRPHWFFDAESELPEQVEIRFVRPPEFAHLSHAQWAASLQAAVQASERQAAAERERTGRRVVGRKAILRQSPFARPKSCIPRRGLRPSVATRDKWRRVELLQRKKQFLVDYRDAYRQRRFGDVDVRFPYGTYQLVQEGLVRCVTPALE